MSKARKPNRGSELFFDYLEEHGLTQQQVATSLGVAKSYVGLLVNSRATPGLGVAADIERITGGSVPCRAWKEPPVVG